MGEVASSSSSPAPPRAEPELNSSLKVLQSDEHQQILDVVAQLRKCGLDSFLPLPQIVVCGDQSSGKSSSLEAITEIPFEQSDNLCTRFATEIHLRTEARVSITVRVIPDPARSVVEQAAISNFKESITDFEDLPRIMDLAKSVMGITKAADGAAQPRAFARDVLSIEYASSDSPQLTLVDIPGLIATETKGVTKADLIWLPRLPTTISSNLRILQKVREVDPEGSRTLGVITKPDALHADSGAETAYLELAKNKDGFFKLGWHVLKNRAFDERDFTLDERNMAEISWFNRSNFKSLPKENVGIGSLKQRLSVLLFEHIKNELPKLKRDLEDALANTREPLHAMGKLRSTATECKAYLSRRAMEFHNICHAAVHGNYEGKYFHKNIDPTFSYTSPSTVCRTRAVVQQMNTEFSKSMETYGHKIEIDMNDGTCSDTLFRIPLVKSQAISWVRQVLVRTRGKELVGNYNPLLIGELFWDQSSRWSDIAEAHVEKVSQICNFFLKNLLNDECPKDVASRVRASLIEEKLKTRKANAYEELALLVKENNSYPINYDPFYSETIQKARMDRTITALEKCVGDATISTPIPGCDAFDKACTTTVDNHKAVKNFFEPNTKDMDDYACEEALDCLFAIYQVNLRSFITDVTKKVIERHIVGELYGIFSPVVVSDLADSVVQSISSEPPSTRNHREFLEARIKKLEDGQEIFRNVM